MNHGSFWVLRRWNSYTPRIPSTLGKSKGGGYFLSWAGNGVVIDPGFDFIDNFQHLNERYGAELKIDKIKSIAITHDHIDHTADFESILMMKVERNKRRPAAPHFREKGMEILLNKDSLLKYESWLASQNNYIINSVRSLEYKNSVDVFRNAGSNDYVRITPLKAFHQKEGEPTQDNAVGLIIELLHNGRPQLRLGITGDTRYPPEEYETEWIAALRECDVVVAHLGGLNLREVICNSELLCKQEITKDLEGFKSSQEEEMFKRVFDCSEDKHLDGIFTSPYEQTGGHLGFWGIFRLFRAVFQGESATKIGIISEFGQELGSYRHKVARVINRTIGLEDKKVFTGDLGLAIELAMDEKQCEGCGRTAMRVGCTRCGKFFCTNCIDEYSIKHREQGIFYNCDTCYQPEYGPRAGSFARIDLIP